MKRKMHSRTCVDCGTKLSVGDLCLRCAWAGVPLARVLGIDLARAGSPTKPPGRPS